eukprot:3941507-Rhodomonas_salina.4
MALAHLLANYLTYCAWGHWSSIEWNRACSASVLVVTFHLIFHLHPWGVGRRNVFAGSGLRTVSLCRGVVCDIIAICCIR